MVVDNVVATDVMDRANFIYLCAYAYVYSAQSDPCYEVSAAITCMAAMVVVVMVMVMVVYVDYVDYVDLHMGKGRLSRSGRGGGGSHGSGESWPIAIDNLYDSVALVAYFGSLFVYPNSEI